MIQTYKIEIDPTKSFTYLLPIYGMFIDFEFLNLLQNSYMMNNEEESLFGVLYKYSGKVAFGQFEEKLMTHPLFASHEDYGEYVLYKFKTNDVIQKAQDLFKVGRYSWYANEQKEAIRDMAISRGFGNYDRIFKILNRDPGIRAEMSKNLGEELPLGAELSSIPEMDDELFTNHLKVVSSGIGGVDFD